MQVIKLRDEYIKLGQALKAAGLVESGVEAKIVITDGEVTVNGQVETQRGKKLYGGDIVEFDGEQIGGNRQFFFQQEHRFDPRRRARQPQRLTQRIDAVRVKSLEQNKYVDVRVGT